MGGRTWLVVAVVMVALLSDVIDAQRAPGFPEYSDIGSNPVDIVFVVDTSAFNNETAEDEIVVKAFIAGFLDNADVDSGAVKAAFITYSTHPKVVFDLDDYSDKSEMVDAVYLSEFEEGERNTADALGKVRSQILRQDRPDVPNVIVLIMTGASDRNSFRTLQESDALKVARSTVFVIGVNLDEDGTNELNQLASKPTMDHSFQVTSFSEFDILKDVLFAQIFDWAEQAYNVPATGTESLDVAFLLHFSHTMTSTAHEQILGFMKSVLQYSGLDGDKVKVGAALLRKKGTVLFDLNAHSGQEEVFEAIDKISYTYRSKPANFASGFDTVRTSLFTESRGDRAEVPNLIILITDANSNEDVGGTITAVEKAKAAGAAVFVVGVNVSYAEEMTSVASSSGFTVLVNDTTYLKDQAMTLYDSFVALRTEGFPVVIPAEQTSLTIPAFETTTPMTTANSEEVDLVIAVHVRHDTKLKYVKKHLQALLKDITDKLDIDSGAVRVALVTFGKSTTVNIKLKDHTDSKKLQKALKNVKPEQYRSKGLEFMQLLNTLETTVLLESEGDRKDVPNLLLIISDGNSDEDARSLSQRSVGMKTKNNTIFAVGINGADAAEISSLATEPVNKHSFMGKTYDDLTTSGDLQRKLKESFKIFEKLAIPSSTDTKDNNDKNPKGTVKPTKPPKPTKTPKPSAGVTKAKAITKKSNTIAEFVTLSTSRRQPPATSTRAPDVTNVIPELTFVPAIPLSDSDAADLVIAIHLSDRVSQGEFAVVQEFLKNIVATTDVESGKVQLGMIFYGVDPELLFHINQYTSLELIQKEIDGLTIDQRSATADASAALGLVRQMLTPMHGRRDDIPAAAVFLTNQASNENNEFLIEAKRRLVEDEIEVFAIGLGMKDKSELVNLASKQANVMNYDNVWMLNDAAADLQTKVRAFRTRSRQPDPLIVMTPEATRRPERATPAITTKQPTTKQATTKQPTPAVTTKQAITKQPTPAVKTKQATTKQPTPAVTTKQATTKQPTRAVTTKQATSKQPTPSVTTKQATTKQATTKQATPAVTTKQATTKQPTPAITTEQATTRQTTMTRRNNLVTHKQVPQPSTESTAASGGLRSNASLSGRSDSRAYTNVTCGIAQFDLVIILDSSTSVQIQNWNTMLAATQTLVSGLDIDNGNVRVGVVVFSNNATVELFLNSHLSKRTLIEAIGRLKYTYGQTNIADALHITRTEMFTRANGDRENIPNVAILITDGNSTINIERTIPEAQTARHRGILLYAIGIGLTDTEELNEITGSEQNRYFIDNFEELEQKLETIFKSLCPETTLIPSTIETTERLSRTTTLAPLKSKCGLATVDVVIIIDASTSVTEANFKKMLDFVKDIVQSGDIDSGDVRVGVVIYSTEVEVQFHLNQYTTEADVVAAIDKIPYIYGSTNTADALKTMHEQMFVTSRGDRPEVDNVAIVLTDGVSNINSRRTIPESEAARNKGIEVYVIGISLTDIREVEGMASIPKTKYLYNVQKFEQLKGLEEDIFGGEPGTDCGKKPVMTTPKPEPKCGLSKVDAVIILDASTSVTEPNYKKMLKFCKDIVDKADIDSGSVRIGVVIYSTDVEIQFHLNQYRTADEVKAAIDKIPYIYGSTNSADALKTMHNTMFTAANGDRPDVDNIAFMVTDGVSNINSRRTIPEAEAARNKGIRVYAIGIGLSDTRELDGMGSEPKSENVFNVKQFDELNDVIEKIFGGDSSACAPDLPPVANAGSDIERRFPVALITLDGRASSDDKAVVKYTWTLQDGTRLRTWSTSTVNLDNQPVGVYTFTLTVEDEKGQSDNDTVRVTVLAQDLPPVANAGSDKTIQLPIDAVLLDGRNSTDDQKIIQYLWRQTGGTADGLFIEGEGTPRLMVENLVEGEYSFTLTVFDALGQSDDDSVNIYVKAADRPPVANAGDDQQVQLPDNNVTLDGRRSTDDVAVVSYAWRLVNGQSDGLRLTGKDASVLKVGNLKSGRYTFELTVSDGSRQTDTDIVDVVVQAQDVPPNANAGDDITIQLPRNYVELNGGRSSDDVKIVDYSWALTSGKRGAMVMEGNRKANVNVRNLEEGAYTFTLTVRDELGQTDDDSVNIVVKAQDIPPKANAGSDVTVQLPDDTVTLDGSRSSDDVAIVNYSWTLLDGEADGLGFEGEFTERLTVKNLRPGNYTFSLSVYDELGQVDDDTVVVNVKARDLPPISNAGNDVTIQLPDDTVKLDGTRSSDDVKVVSYFWSLEDGNSDGLELDGLTSSVLTVKRLRQGKYTFTLTVHDDAGQVDKNDVIVNVIAQDFPPVANAGGDVMIQLPVDTATLNGSLSTDDVKLVRYVWMLEQGAVDGLVLAGDDTPVLDVKNLKEGIYTFALTVFDQLGQTDSDRVMVIVSARDNPPVANAGSDVTIQLPVNSVTLDGSRSTDDNGVARYLWSGDRRVRLADVNSVRPLVEGLVEGVYRFNLTVFDALGQADEDYVDVTVRAADKPPNAVAGEDIVITLPRNSVTLDGSRSSDDVGIVRYRWRLSDGDERAVTMRGDRTSVLQLTDLRPGAYTFSLTVVDAKGQNDVDNVTVIVQPAPTTPQPACGLAATDLVFVVDASTSVTETNFQKQLLFMKSIVEYADIDSGSVRVGALIYSTEVEVQFYLNQYTTKQAVLEAVSKIPYIYGSTNTADGLKVMRDQLFSFRNGDRDDATNVAMVITDGVSNINSRRTIPEAQQSRDVGIHIYAIGIGLTDTRELEAMASEPSASNTFAVSDFTELQGLEKRIFQSICKETPAPATTTIMTTTPAPVVEKPCGLAKTDLVFILDASTSVTDANFQKMRDFLKEFLSNADIDSGSIRVGINLYSTDVDVQFHLNRYTTSRDVMAAVDRIPYIYGSTNTADALKSMSEVMFTPANGDRPDAPNVCILLTDGVSNINSRRTIPEAEAARAKGIHLYVIGIALQDTREVDAIATPPAADNSFHVETFDQLKGLHKTIFSASCPEKKDDPPRANAGPDRTVQLPEEYVIISGDGSKDDIGIVKYEWSQIYGPAVQVNLTNDPRLTLRDLQPGTYVLELTVTDMLGQEDTDNVTLVVVAQDAPPVANAGADQTIQLPDNSVNLDGSRSTDDVRIITYRWRLTSGDDRGVRLTGDRTPRLNVNGLNQGEYVFTLTVEDGKEQLSTDDVRIIVQPLDAPPVANAGTDQTIRLPNNNVILDGSRSTDDVRIITYRWRLTSGDDRGVRLTGDRTPRLNVNGLKEGEYVFQLTVEDGKEQLSNDEVRVFVQAVPDAPPVANAGPDQTLQLPTNRAILDGTRSTDDVRIVTYNWKLKSGDDSGVRMTGDRTPRLSVEGLKEGEYVFTLTVSDGKEQLSTDEARIVVQAEPNAPPVANAGPDQTIRLPVDNVVLDGSKSTDDKRIVTYRWKLTTGDSRGVRLTGDRTPRLSVAGLKEGEYVFQLEVSDQNELLDYDEARVVVQRAPRVTGYDVIFVLDSSVTPEHFRWMINYTRDAVRQMNIDDEEFRVGYLIYSNTGYKQFDLKDHLTKADVQAAVNRVVYRPGTKNTAAALKHVRTKMFTPENGDRDFAKNYIIHLTGNGTSDDPFEAATEACTIQGQGVGMFGVGFGDVRNRDELDAQSSVPTSDWALTIRNEAAIGETPGLMLYGIKNRTPRPSQCPEKATHAPSECFASADVVFVLDSSGSVGQDNFYRLLNFTYQTVDGLDIDSGRFRVGVTTFSDTSRLDFNLNEFKNKRDIEDALTKVVYMYGNTHTAHALRRARLEMFTAPSGDRLDVPNVVVIITDGQSNVNHELTIPEARMLKAAGVSIITLAVGFTSETSELVGITSEPVQKNLIYIENYESLGKVKEQLISPLCTDSNLCSRSPCARGVCLDGIRSYVCQCPDGFFGTHCEKQCGEPSDVVIVLDSSNTVGQYNFGRLKEYAQHLVRQMNKDSCDINIGFMKYSSNAMVQVPLGQYADTDTNIQALDQISYSRGRANMAAAFRAIRTEMFNGRRGDRTTAKNIAFVLTDGTNDVHREMTEPEAELTISSGIRIIPIGINLRERYELDNIAEKQGINVIEIRDEIGLLQSTDVILDTLRKGKDFCSENPCRNGGSCKNEAFGYTCECAVGFTGDSCTQSCSAKGDVVFVVDTSRYVTRKELKSIRKFMRSIVNRLKFHKDEFSMGMVQFTNNAHVTLTLDEGHSKKAVRSAIAGLRVHGGDPEPAQALAKAAFRIFKGRGESREKPDYMILVTKSMRDEEKILTEANKLKIDGTRILGVGMGLTADEQEYMKSVVSMPFRDTAMFTNETTDLELIADKIVQFMCEDENLCAENPCRNGGKCLRVGGDFYCECGVGYAGRYCENKCNARADIVFLLDSSGSVGHVDFRNVKQFVTRMVSDLQIGRDASRIGLATYSSKSRHGFFMNKYQDLFQLQNAIEGISYEYGNTNTAEGLRMIREHYFNGQNGDRKEIQDFLVVLTDGVSNVNPDQTLVEAKLMKDKGVHIYAVGVGDFDSTEINGIASNPASKNAFLLRDYTALSNISSNIVRATCRDPSVCENNPCKNGGICVPGINGLFCECRVGYRGEFCNESCVSDKDIFFLLDSSDSVGSQNFEAAKRFVTSIIEEFSSKDARNRFSLVTFSTEVQIVFSLGRYKDLPIIQNAVKYTRYRPGNTNTAGALRVVEEISHEELGDRFDAENIIFVITDGVANVNEDDTIPAATAVKNKGARIISIGVNLNERTEIERMASSPTDVFTVRDFDALEGITADIVKTTCKNGNIIKFGK